MITTRGIDSTAARIVLHASFGDSFNEKGSTLWRGLLAPFDTQLGELGQGASAPPWIASFTGRLPGKGQERHENHRGNLNGSRRERESLRVCDGEESPKRLPSEPPHTQ